MRKLSGAQVVEQLDQCQSAGKAYIHELSGDSLTSPVKIPQATCWHLPGQHLKGRHFLETPGEIVTCAQDPSPPWPMATQGAMWTHFLSLQTHPPCLLSCCQSNPKALLCGLSWPVACAPRDWTVWAVPPWVWSESECRSSGDARKDFKRAVLGGLSLFLSDCVSWDMSAFENLCSDASEVKGQPWGMSSWTLYDSVLKANQPCLWCFWPSWGATEAQRGRAPGLGHTARKWGTWREAQTPRVRKRGESFSGPQTSQKHSFLLKGIKARDNKMLI